MAEDESTESIIGDASCAAGEAAAVLLAYGTAHDDAAAQALARLFELSRNDLFGLFKEDALNVEQVPQVTAQLLGACDLLERYNGNSDAEETFAAERLAGIALQALGRAAAAPEPTA